MNRNLKYVELVGKYETTHETIFQYNLKQNVPPGDTRPHSETIRHIFPILAKNINSFNPHRILTYKESIGIYKTSGCGTCKNLRAWYETNKEVWEGFRKDDRYRNIIWCFKFHVRAHRCRSQAKQPNSQVMQIVADQ